MKKNNMKMIIIAATGLVAMKIMMIPLQLLFEYNISFDI